MLKRTIKQRMKFNEISVGERFRKDYKDIPALADNIKEHGLLQPLVVSAEGLLLAGGRRHAACALLGLPDVPVVILSTEGELDEREIELIENVFREDMEWHEKAALEKRIFDLRKEKDPSWGQRDNADLMGQSLGLSNRRLQLAGYLEKFPQLANCETENEAVKVIRGMTEAVVVHEIAKENKKNPAYKWAADHYHLGDAVAGLRSLQPGVMDFAEVDPPYGVDLIQHKSKLQLGADDPSIAPYQEVDAKEYPEFIAAAARETYRVLKDNSYCIWWHASVWASTVRGLLEQCGFKVHGVPAIWHKVNYNGQSNMPDRMLSNGFEPFWICEKGQARLHRPGRNNVFSYQPPTASERFHPAERPVDLLLDILDTFTAPGNIVVSPFLGSGNTIRAAYRCHRVAFGWDLSPEYKDKFLARVSEEHVDPNANGADNAE